MCHSSLSFLLFLLLFINYCVIVCIRFVLCLRCVSSFNKKENKCSECCRNSCNNNNNITRMLFWWYSVWRLPRPAGRKWLFPVPLPVLSLIVWLVSSILVSRVKWYEGTQGPSVKSILPLLTPAEVGYTYLRNIWDTPFFIETNWCSCLI